MTEAERLATHLEKKPRWTHEIEAAALLRSLQAENEALRVDAERYRWLRRNLVGLSFSDSLIASLCKDQSELDAAIKGEPTC